MIMKNVIVKSVGYCVENVIDNKDLKYIYFYWKSKKNFNFYCSTSLFHFSLEKREKLFFVVDLDYIRFIKSHYWWSKDVLKNYYWYFDSILFV